MKLHYGDLTDSTCLVKIINDVKPTEIYNLGAQSHVKVSHLMLPYVTLAYFHFMYFFFLSGVELKLALELGGGEFCNWPLQSFITLPYTFTQVSRHLVL